MAEKDNETHDIQEAMQKQREHEAAMNLVEEAMQKKREKDMDGFKQLSLQAFELEKEAAMYLLDKSDCEPTRSILFRSAGYIAIDAELYQEAFAMAEHGLKYAIHDETIQELTELKSDAQAKL